MTFGVPDTPWHPQLSSAVSFEPQRLTEDGVTVRASFVLPPRHFDEEEHPWSTWQSPVLPLWDFCHDCPLLLQVNSRREGARSQRRCGESPRAKVCECHRKTAGPQFVRRQ